MASFYEKGHYSDENGILSARAFSEERLLICVLVNSFEAIYGQLSHFAKMAF